eukprot:3509727-Rhodomonas_salina.1
MKAGLTSGVIAQSVEREADSPGISAPGQEVRGAAPVPWRLLRRDLALDGHQAHCHCHVRTLLAFRCLPFLSFPFLPLSFALACAAC